MAQILDVFLILTVAGLSVWIAMLLAAAAHALIHGVPISVSVKAIVGGLIKLCGRR